jgi:VWFA-related protein
MRPLRRLPRVLSTLSLLAVAAASQADQTFRSTVDAVRVDALVMRGGRPVSGLTAADFELRDNGVVQDVAAVSVDDVPLTLMLVLDVSQSVQGEPLAQLRAAIEASASALSAADRLALFTFSHHVAAAAQATRDFADLRSAALRVEASGATALYDATLAALMMRHRIEGRAVMLVFSDGVDTASWIDPRASLAAAQRSDVTVYGVTLARQMERRDARAVRQATLEQDWFRRDPWSYGRQYLPLLAADTGGSILTAERADRLRETFVGVVRDFKSRYLLTYTPRDVAPGGWHSVDVRLKRQPAEITARRGYLRDGQ